MTFTCENGAKANTSLSPGCDVCMRSNASSENEVLALRPVAGSIEPLFSPARDIRPPIPSTFLKRTRSSGCGTGSDRSSASLTRLKMAVLAPMPSASDRTATAVNPGLFTS